ncbi:hypothetical protein ACVBGC_19255 [Burkholderia stagnalis]
MTISVTTAGSLSLARMAQATLDGRDAAAAAGLPDDASTLAVVPVSGPDQTAVSAQLDKISKLLSIPADLSAGLRGVANELATSMREILARRPDLADAQFDFETDNGSLRVVSKTLNEADRTWIEQTLNANTSLVLAAGDFHKQAVAGYEYAATANDDTFTASDRAAASQRADTQFQFMSLINEAVERNRKALPQDSLVTSNGTPLKVEPSAGTARGTLALLDTARTLASGAAMRVSDGETGRKTYSYQTQLIDVGFDVLDQYLPKDGKRLGFHEIA